MSDIVELKYPLMIHRKAIARLLLEFDARHKDKCPQRQQNYWRARPEYRPPNYGPDKVCTCGLDAILGKADDRRQF
jgi:hypothetical protein